MRLVLVAIALLIAGCNEAPASAADEPEASSTMTSTGVAADLPRVVAVPTLVPVSWQGHTKEGAWVCMEQAGTGQCPAGQQVQPDGGHVTSVAYQGNLTGIEVELTWTPDPSQTGLVLAAYGNTSAGFTLLASTQGLSPLALALDAAAVAEVVPGNAVVFMVWPQGKTPTSPSVFVDATQQEFTLEGQLSTSVDVAVAS